MLLERDKSFKFIATSKSEEINYISSKESFNEGERGEWKSWFITQHSNHGIRSHYFMENIWGNSDRLYFLGLQNHWDSDCSHEIKRHLLLERIAMTNTHSILKSRHITLLTKFCIIKGMIFIVVMYGHESWTIKKREHWRIDAFKLWCWRRLLKVPWRARRSNQSTLKEISSEYSLEGHTSKVMLKILQARLQQYVKCELPDVQDGFRKGREPEIKLPTSTGSSKKQ